MKQSLPDGVDADFDGETGGLLEQETSVIFFYYTYSSALN